jgi:hypothetical protein
MARTKQPKTNVQIVRDLMEFSKFGALSQMFIIDAITKQAALVAKSRPSDYPAGGFVEPTAWIGVAKEIEARMAEAYGRGM